MFLPFLYRRHWLYLIRDLSTFSCKASAYLYHLLTCRILNSSRFVCTIWVCRVLLKAFLDLSRCECSCWVLTWLTSLKMLLKSVGLDRLDMCRKMWNRMDGTMTSSSASELHLSRTKTINKMSNSTHKLFKLVMQISNSQIYVQMFRVKNFVCLLIMLPIHSSLHKTLRTRLL